MKYKGRKIEELTEKEVREALNDILVKYNTALYELVAIKTGIINEPPEKAYGDWTVKKIQSLSDAKEHAGKTLERLGYRNSLV